jgi:hypothetical protein
VRNAASDAMLRQVVGIPNADVAETSVAIVAVRGVPIVALICTIRVHMNAPCVVGYYVIPVFPLLIVSQVQKV